MAKIEGKGALISFIPTPEVLAKYPPMEEQTISCQIDGLQGSLELRPYSTRCVTYNGKAVGYVTSFQMVHEVPHASVVITDPDVLALITKPPVLSLGFKVEET